MTSILLVGASGQLGWEVSRRSSARSMPCVALNGEQLDITERDAVLRTVERLKPSTIVNAAAYTAVDKAEANPDMAFAVNELGAAHLAEAGADAGAQLVHISTDYVFDGNKRAPYNEDDLPAPLSLYGRSKLAGEDAVRKNCPQSHVILRTSWLYGIRGHNFVKTMLRLGQEQKTLRIVDDQFGNPTFAGDLANAILDLAARWQCGRWPDDGFGTFHCAGQDTTTWYRLARLIFKLGGERLEQHPRIVAIGTADYFTPATRPLNSALDCSRLHEVHGIVLRRWNVALAEMLDEFLGQTDTENEVPRNVRATQ